MKRSQIASVPMAAVLKGMLHEKIPRFGPRFMDVRGLFSVMMRHATTSPEQDARFPGPLLRPALGLLSQLHRSRRVPLQRPGYLLQPHAQQELHRHALPGGGRGPRAEESQGEIHRGHPPRMRLHGEHQPGHGHRAHGKGGLEEIKEQLEMLGRLLQFFRQMDAAMASDEHARLFQEAFLKGDYDLREMLGGGNANGAQPKGRDSTNG